MIVSELLFCYASPDLHGVTYSRIAFGLFFFCFIVLGIAFLDFYFESSTTSPQTITLWHGAVLIVGAFWLLMPSLRFLSIVSFQVDRRYFILSQIWVGFEAFLLILRAIHNILWCFGAEPVMNWLEHLQQSPALNPIDLGGVARLFFFITEFFFNFVANALPLIGVKLLNNYQPEDNAECTSTSDFQSLNPPGLALSDRIANRPTAFQKRRHNVLTESLMESHRG
jgi:hypothetical protein